MKLQILLLGFLVTSCATAVANDLNPVEPENCKKTKNETIGGNIIDNETRKPLKDVTVTAYLDSKKEKVALTDKEGNFSLASLKPGLYMVVFEKKGYKKQSRQNILVKVDESMRFDIELEDSPEYNILPSPFHFF